jgi:hypothetical protein
MNRREAIVALGVLPSMMRAEPSTAPIELAPMNLTAILTEKSDGQVIDMAELGFSLAT